MRKISELFNKENIIEYCDDITCVNGDGPVFKDKSRINIIAMGDVGGTVLLGLRILGGEYIKSIGIFDINEKILKRYEREINQVVFPDGRDLPEVKILEENDLFDCDAFVFCATKGIPGLAAKGDVRMAQFEANRGLVEFYAKKACDARYNGLFAVVSDPVDPLCKAAALAGISPEKIRGYGLGVMNARACYCAEKDDRFASYKKEGRAFGPHGEDLVICNSIYDYNDEISKELTELALRSNHITREDGFKPYIAPAMSSAAISLLETIRGGWHYSSVYTGSVFLGCRNRRNGNFTEIENIEIDEVLYKRIEKAVENLKKVI